MKINQILTMLFERGDAMQSFWGFYISIALGILAFFGSGRRSRRLALLVSIAFVAFAVVNLSGMYSIARQRVAFFDLLSDPEALRQATTSAVLPNPTIDALVMASKPPDPTGVAAFHIVIDAGVLGAVWLLTTKSAGKSR